MYLCLDAIGVALELVPAQGGAWPAALAASLGGSLRKKAPDGLRRTQGSLIEIGAPGHLEPPGAWRGASFTPRHVKFDGDHWLVGPAGKLVLRPSADVGMFLWDHRAGHTEGDVVTLAKLGVVSVLSREGIGVLHAAAFRVDHCGVLAVGEGKSGKSTVSALSWRFGGRVVSDDTIAICLDGRGIAKVSPFRRDMLLRADASFALPPDVSESVIPIPRAKDPRLLVPRDDLPSFFTDAMPISAIWMVSIDRRLRRSVLRAASSASAFAAVVRSMSPLYLSPEFPEERRALLRTLGVLVNTSRAFRLWLGRDLRSAPEETFARLLEESGAGVSRARR